MLSSLAYKHEMYYMLILKIYLIKSAKNDFKKLLSLVINGNYTFSRPCTKSPDSYLNDDSASHNLEHFLSAGVRKRHNVLTICKRKYFSIKIGN